MLVAAAALAGCGGGDDDDGEETAGLPEGCAEVEAPAPKDEEFAAARRSRSTGPPPRVVETSCGDFTIELDSAAGAEDDRLVRRPRRAGLLRRHWRSTGSSRGS